MQNARQLIQAQRGQKNPKIAFTRLRAKIQIMLAIIGYLQYALNQKFNQGYVHSKQASNVLKNANLLNHKNVNTTRLLANHVKKLITRAQNIRLALYQARRRGDAS